MQLDQVRDQRIRAEFDIQHLKSQLSKQQDQKKQKEQEKKGALDHYDQSNSGFDRNLKMFNQQLQRKIEVQEKIVQHTLNDKKYPIHSIDQMIKDKNQADLIEVQEKQKSMEDEKNVRLKQIFHRKNMSQLKNDINEQRMNTQYGLKKLRQTQINEGQ